MRREIPEGVHVAPDRTEIGTRRVQVVDPADLSLVHVLSDPPDASVVEEGVADHQGPPLGLCQRCQRTGVGYARRERLLAQDVLAGVQGGPSHLVVRRGGRADDHRVDTLDGERLLDVRGQDHPRESAPDLLQAIEALRPGRFRPHFHDWPKESEDYPMGLRYFEDVGSRDAESLWHAWREVRVGQLNAELAIQLHSLSMKNSVKRVALRRLYAGLRILTLLVAGLLTLFVYAAWM